MHRRSGSFVASIFIIIIFVCLAALETNLYILTSFYYHPSPTEIEIVLYGGREEETTYRSPNVLSVHTTGSQPAVHGIPPSAVDALQYYDSRILHQLSLFRPGVSPVLRIVSILQKSNVWHQSSDEDPLLYG